MPIEDNKEETVTPTPVEATPATEEPTPVPPVDAEPEPLTLEQQVAALRQEMFEVKAALMFIAQNVGPLVVHYRSGMGAKVAKPVDATPATTMEPAAEVEKAVEIERVSAAEAHPELVAENATPEKANAES